MAKWFGKIGFEGQTVETAPSVFTEETVEREYYGDVLEWGRQLQAGDGVNDNVTFQNRLSIVADPFAHENFGSIQHTREAEPAWHQNGVLTVCGKSLIDIFARVGEDFRDFSFLNSIARQSGGLN